MPSRLLSQDEIIRLAHVLKGIYRNHAALRAQEPTAKFISVPPIPQVLTRSLAVACVCKWFGSQWHVELGRRSRETILLSHESESKSVAVKATGKSGFQEIKEKDLKVDCLVWIDFGESLTKGFGEIVVYVFENPAAAIKERRRITRADFIRLGEEAGSLKSHRYPSLDAMFH
jgi:hypothetical protein